MVYVVCACDQQFPRSIEHVRAIAPYSATRIPRYFLVCPGWLTCPQKIPTLTQIIVQGTMCPECKSRWSVGYHVVGGIFSIHVLCFSSSIRPLAAMPCNFPSEIYALIMEELAASRGNGMTLSIDAARALQQCSLVCLQFRWRAQLHLFEVLVITSPSHAHSLLRVLNASQYISRSVARLRIQGQDSQPEMPPTILDNIADVIPEIISLCTRLSMFDLCNLSIRSIFEDKSIFNAWSQSLRQSIIMGFTVEDCDQQAWQMSLLLKQFTCLVRLAVRSNTIDNPMEQRHMRTFKPAEQSLQRLIIEDNLAGWFYQLNVQSLKRLDLVLSDPQACVYYQALLSHTTPSLEHITVNLTFACNVDGIAGWADVSRQDPVYPRLCLDMSSCAGLRILEVVCKLDRVFDLAPEDGVLQSYAMQMVASAYRSPCLSLLQLHTWAFDATFMERFPWIVFLQMLAPRQTGRSLKMELIIHASTHALSAACIRLLEAKLARENVAGFECVVGRPFSS
jgi:hypothetical protein